MTPERFKYITVHYNFRHDGVSRFFGVNERTARRWASGEMPIPRYIGLLLELMIRTDTSPQDCLRWEGSLSKAEIKQMRMFRDEGAWNKTGGNVA